MSAAGPGAAKAGTMASSQGSATLTPAALRKVRLERRFRMTIMKSLSVHLKKFAADDSQDQAGELVIVRGHTGDNASDFGPILALDAAPERVDEHFLGETFRKGFLLLFQDCFQLRRALEGPAVRKHTRRINRELPIHGPPCAHGIVVLEPEAQRIHASVARGADGIFSVLLHLLPERSHCSNRVLVQTG